MDERDTRRVGGEDQEREGGAERRRVAEITSELRRRAKLDYLREEARKVMVRRTTDLRNRAITSLMVLGTAGAILGTLAARLVRSMTANRREHLIEWESLDQGDNGHGGGRERLGERVRARAEDVAGEVKAKASQLGAKAGELKDRALDAVDEARQAVSDKVAEVRERQLARDHHHARPHALVLGLRQAQELIRRDAALQAQRQLAGERLRPQPPALAGGRQELVADVGLELADGRHRCRRRRRHAPRLGRRLDPLGDLLLQEVHQTVELSYRDARRRAWVSPATRFWMACRHSPGNASTRAARFSARVASGAKSRRIRSSSPAPMR